MEARALKSDILLLLTAIIWGFAFVAQRMGMDHVGPYTYNGIRFFLGSLSLIPIMLICRRNESSRVEKVETASRKTVVFGGGLAGLFLFLGASMQQVGLVYTTAGKAGFITGLYVVIVPITGLLWHQRPAAGTWVGAFMATAGLYLLSITKSFTIAYGDFLVLVSAFFFAGHVHIIGWLSPKIDSLKLSFYQFVACSALSLATAFLIETITLSGIREAMLPILYGGFLSVGVAYTLQVVGQKDAKPAHATIILSMEGLFAAVGGWLMLNESLSMRGMVGCGLMLCGMLLSQMNIDFKLPKKQAESLRT